jgi:hypothetical protein
MCFQTVLKGESLKSKDKFFGDNGNGGKNPRVNPEALNLWLSTLSRASDEDNQPILWIQQMLQIGPKDRIASVHLLDDVLGYADQHIYYVHCCADHDEEASSCKSSEFEDSDTGGLGIEESTNATSVLSERSGEDKTLVGVAEITPSKSTPSLTQNVLEESLDSSRGNPDFLTDRSGQSASPFESILRARTPVPQPPDDTTGQESVHYEIVNRTVSQPEVPMWQSKNPFRPNYTPSHTAESAPPQGSMFHSPSQTQAQLNPFFASASEEPTPIVEREETSDSVKSPLSDNDTTQLNTLLDHASTEPETVPSMSEQHNLSIGSNPSLNTLNSLFDSAVNGDVSGISTYLSAGNELHEGAFAKSVFHAAAVNEQWAIMQLLIDAGCSVFPDDVTAYILPAIGNRQVEINDLKFTHRAILEQIKAVRTRKKHEGLMIEDSNKGNELEYSEQNRFTASVRKDSAQRGTLGPLGPWEPGGMHWDLTVTPDPEYLHKMVRKGDYVQVLSTINAGYSLNMRDEEGLSPLDIAIELGLTSFIQTLDIYGANPKLRNARGLDAYDQARARFYGEELRQVISIFDQHKETRRPDEGQLPRTNHASWDSFLRSNWVQELPKEKRSKKHNISESDSTWPELWQIAVPARYRWLLTSMGHLMWYEWPQQVLDAYPGEVFELEDTSLDTSIKSRWVASVKNQSNKPKWLRKLFNES